MSDEDIDLDRVVVDPAYRRQVIEFLNAAEPGEDRRAEAMPMHPLMEPREGLSRRA
jgi:hypothetical protein